SFDGIGGGGGGDRFGGGGGGGDRGGAGRYDNRDRDGRDRGGDRGGDRGRGGRNRRYRPGSREDPAPVALAQGNQQTARHAFLAVPVRLRHVVGRDRISRPSGWPPSRSDRDGPRFRRDAAPAAEAACRGAQPGQHPVVQTVVAGDAPSQHEPGGE